jgi:hypothetical protein
MLKKIVACAILATTVTFTGCSTTSLAEQAVSMFADDALVSGLTSDLGINALQAAGGLGSVMSLASSKLSPADFATLGKTFGNSSKYLDIAKQAGVLPGPIADLAGLNSAFGKLGISPETGVKMLSQVSDFAGKTGGDTTKSLLTGLLK